MHPKSFSETVGSDAETEFGDLVADPKSGSDQETIALKLDLEATAEEITNILSDERQRNIVLERMGFFGESRTLEEIGKEFGITRERVRQLESQGRAKLRGRIAIEDEYILRNAKSKEQ